jgi:hypothetical protein
VPDLQAYASVVVAEHPRAILDQYLAAASDAWNGSISLDAWDSNPGWLVRLGNTEMPEAVSIGVTIGRDADGSWCVGTLHPYGDELPGSLAWLIHCGAAQRLGAVGRPREGDEAGALLSEMMRRCVSPDTLDWR